MAMTRRPLSGDLVVETPGFPRFYRAEVAGIDLATWAAEHSPRLAAALLADGALWFRGFAIGKAADFERAAAVLLGTPDLGYPELELAGGHYRPTPYPADEAIPFHNEGAHRDAWPLRQAFACLIPATTGGETPLVDGRRILAEGGLPAQLIDRGVRYQRRVVSGLDSPLPGVADGETVVARRPAVRAHQETGELLPFHQILTHHPAMLPARLRDAALRDARYGDGEVIPDVEVEKMAAAYARSAVAVPWEAGDMVVLDNLRVAHGRNRFSGTRSLLVALAGATPAGCAPAQARAAPG